MMPLPPNVDIVPHEDTPPEDTYNGEGQLTDYEYGFILDSSLVKKHRKDPEIIAFIDAFVRCKSIAQASEECKIHPSLGYRYRHRKDIAGCIQRMIDKSAVKHGFDASEVLERTKEMVDFDPIEVMNQDGTYKSNLYDIVPEARRSIKKLKVKNLYNQTEDINGISKKIIIGEVIEYEFYDKLKAIELVGREKEMFKNTTKVEHSVTKDMASLLLASTKRAERVIENQSKEEIIEVVPRHLGEEDA